MGKARNKAGRKALTGARYASGDLKPKEDYGTPQQRGRKLAITTVDNMEITPLGILRGRRLITDEQYTSACNFQRLYRSVYFKKPEIDVTQIVSKTPPNFLMASPSMPLPFSAKLPSDPHPWDEPITAEPQENKWQADRNRLREVQENLTLAMWETISRLVVREQYYDQDQAMFTQIVALDIKGEYDRDTRETRVVSGKRVIPLSVRRRIEEIAVAIDRLTVRKKRTVGAMENHLEGRAW